MRGAFKDVSLWGPLSLNRDVVTGVLTTMGLKGDRVPGIHVTKNGPLFLPSYRELSPAAMLI